MSCWPPRFAFPDKAAGLRDDCEATGKAREGFQEECEEYWDSCEGCMRTSLSCHHRDRAFMYEGAHL